MARGKVIAFEGIDGAGKSEQAKRLASWLDDEGYKLIATKWNSSANIHPLIKDLKKVHKLTPRVYSLMHAADFADRWDREIKPALDDSKLVVADRWKYTAYARDAARSIPATYVRGLYSFVPDADLVFYLRVTIDESLRRLHRQDRPPKYYESGMDLGLADDAEESFTLFQSRVLRHYEPLVKEFNFHVIDGGLPQDKVFAEVKAEVSKLLKI